MIRSLKENALQITKHAVWNLFITVQNFFLFWMYSMFIIFQKKLKIWLTLNKFTLWKLRFLKKGQWTNMS